MPNEWQAGRLRDVLFPRYTLAVGEGRASEFFRIAEVFGANGASAAVLAEKVRVLNQPLELFGVRFDEPFFLKGAQGFFLIFTHDGFLSMGLAHCCAFLFVDISLKPNGAAMDFKAA